MQSILKKICKRLQKALSEEQYQEVATVLDLLEEAESILVQEDCETSKIVQIAGKNKKCNQFFDQNARTFCSLMLLEIKENATEFVKMQQQLEKHLQVYVQYTIVDE